MPTNEFIDIDFGSRPTALIAAGIAMGLSGANLPSQGMANSQRNYLFYINKMRVAKSLPPLPGLDYSGFQGALNQMLKDAGYVAAPIVIDTPHAYTADGLTTAGKTINCTKGNWYNEPSSYTYQWTRAGANIAGATAATYVIVVADAGTLVACKVTATNANGNATATSNTVQC